MGNDSMPPYTRATGTGSSVPVTDGVERVLFVFVIGVFDVAPSVGAA